MFGLNKKRSFKVIHPVQLSKGDPVPSTLRPEGLPGDKIYQVGDIVTEDLMTPGFGEAPTLEQENDPNFVVKPWAPNEWDSLVKSGHLQEIN